MEHIFAGRAVVLGENVDTDQIYPGRYLAMVEPEEIAKHCMEGLDSEVNALLSGSIVLAGKNFGCGSSREHAVISLIHAGVRAVVAPSFARIFFRNAINLGLPLLVCKDVEKWAETGDMLLVDIEKGILSNESTGEVRKAEQLGEHIMSIIAAGGIKPLMQKKVRAEKRG